MKRIFIFPTIEEAKGFILTEPKDAVFIGGVGMAEIAAATIRAVKAKKPHLAVLCGIAGAFDRSTARGEVVEVVTERVAGLPPSYTRIYETSAPDTGLPAAAGLTVSVSGAGVAHSEAIAAEDELPVVENMEGAAFFAACDALGIVGCQIRAVSNYVGEPFEEWAVDQAVENLTKTLTQIFADHE